MLFVINPKFWLLNSSSCIYSVEDFGLFQSQRGFWQFYDGGDDQSKCFRVLGDFQFRYYFAVSLFDFEKVVGGSSFRFLFRFVVVDIFKCKSFVF